MSDITDLDDYTINEVLDNVQNEYETTKDVYLVRCNNVLKDKVLMNEIMNQMFKWCGISGATMMPLKKNGKFMQMPVSLFPHLLPINEWLELRQVSLTYHKLVNKISRDHSFLLKRLKCIAKDDPLYFGKFYEIFEKKVKLNEFNAKYFYTTIRSDYMRNTTKNNDWSQIEVQFTPGGIWLVHQTKEMHKYVIERYVMNKEIPYYDYKNIENNKIIKNNKLFLSPNDTVDRFVTTIVKIARKVHPKNPTILFIGDSAITDWYGIEIALWQKAKIPVIERTYAEVGKNGKLDPKTKDLIIDSKYRVSFIYCRGGSKRKEFNDPNGYDWKGRELIEFCTAVVDTNVIYTLINAKFMQSIFCEKEVLSKYLTEKEANLLSKHFVPVYNFDPSVKSEKEINAVLNDAKKNYDNYVMKPSGDGGGHCIFNKNIADLIESLTKKEASQKNKIKLGGWVLMEKIKEVITNSVHFRSGNGKLFNSVHEVGIFSHFLTDVKTGELVIDECIGDLTKTKKSEANEGGIMAGYGVMDSVILYQ